MAEFLSLGGSMNAKDQSSENKVPVTAVKDGNGEWVLRTVDAAPFAYENATDTLKTKVQNTVDVNEVKSFNVKRVTRSGSISADSNEILIDTREEIIIHSMIFSQDTDASTLRANISFNGQSVISISNDGSNVSGSSAISPGILRDRQMPFFELVKDSQNQYVYGLKKEHTDLKVKDAKVSIHNVGSSAQNMACIIFYSEVV